MITFGELSTRWAGVVISIVLVLVVLIAILFVMSVAEKLSRKYILISGGLLLFEYAAYKVLYSSYHRKGIKGMRFLSELVISIPAVPIIIITFLVALLVISWILFFIRWNKNNVTVASVKDAINDMEAGIVCSNEMGVPVMVNPNMEYLCEYITGKPLLNANFLWDSMVNNNLKEGCEVIDQGNTLLLQIPTGRIFKLKRRQIRVDEILLNELFATEITNLYKASIELKEGNERLESMNNRMKNLNDTITRVTIEREVLGMKIKVHDNLGRSLLSAKRYLVSGEGNLSEIISEWRENTHLIDSDMDTQKTDEYSLMFKTAKDVGVTIKVQGILPQDKARKKIIATAMHECITNTIRHADGDELYISIVRDRPLTIEFTNNGKPPESKVRLTGGGLDMLRRMVRDYGGDARVESSPVFKLIIEL